MTWQQPSVGRIVHYVSFGTPGGEFGKEHRAAVITAVKSATEVSLCVINPTGFFFHESSMFIGENEAKQTADGDFPGGTWHYPERVESPAAGPVTFLVNHVERTLASRVVSYDEIANLAGMGPERCPTVTYHRAAGPKESGSLVKGESVEVVDGTRITCLVTGRA